MPRWTALLLLAFCPACTWWTAKREVLVTSEPPGARVFVDGTDTGRTTPTVLTIGGSFGHDHTIGLERQGFRPATRRVYQHTRGYTSKWIEGSSDVTLPPLPLFWTFGDMFVPFAVQSAVLPGELYIVLEADDSPLLGFDLLAHKAAAGAGKP